MTKCATESLIKKIDFNVTLLSEKIKAAKRIAGNPNIISADIVYFKETNSIETYVLYRKSPFPHRKDEQVIDPSEYVLLDEIERGDIDSIVESIGNHKEFFDTLFPDFQDED